MKPALNALLLILLLITVMMGLGSLVCIGLGVLLARWLPLSLFQASALAIGATIAVAAIIHIIFDIMQFHRESLYDNFESEDEEEDDEFDPDASDRDIPFPEPDFSKVGKNDYCPCGSGRKFKNCCGNVTVK